MCARLPFSATVLLPVFLALLAAPAVAATPSTESASPETGSLVNFTVFGRALLPIKREGRFTEFTGQLAYDPARPADTHVDITVYTSSVDVHDTEESTLLRSDKFFDAERFPTMHSPVSKLRRNVTAH